MKKKEFYRTIGREIKCYDTYGTDKGENNTLKQLTLRYEGQSSEQDQIPQQFQQKTISAIVIKK